MGKKIPAIYKNGAFVPDREVQWSEGGKAWIEIDERFAPSLPPGSPLLAAEREFEIAFANGGYDPDRANAGCALAWAEISAAIRRAMGASGWEGDELAYMLHLDGLEKNDEDDARVSWVSRYGLAKDFRDRTELPDGECCTSLRDEPWQFESALEIADGLILNLNKARRIALERRAAKREETG